jgi:hypothetical protein
MGRARQQLRSASASSRRSDGGGAERTLSAVAEAALLRALRDIADGHLAVWRSADGRDYADRTLAGAPQQWWLVLAQRGLYLPPEHETGPWRLVASA